MVHATAAAGAAGVSDANRCDDGPCCCLVCLLAAVMHVRLPIRASPLSVRLSYRLLVVRRVFSNVFLRHQLAHEGPPEGAGLGHGGQYHCLTTEAASLLHACLLQETNMFSEGWSFARLKLLLGMDLAGLVFRSDQQLQ